MEKQLEPAIAAMVADFIAAGRPKASQLSWQTRRDGYLASALLGGEREEVGAIEEWQPITTPSAAIGPQTNRTPRIRC